jgi:BirA family biotin operon repressor/biotin-[acetyl-CoA-carboxylase] ligase
LTSLTPTIRLVAFTGSTNADLLADRTAREGAWLVARRQRAGRGRAGRPWSDGAGNFMGSTVVNLRQGDPPAHTLALVAGLAAFEAVAAEPGRPRDLILKWPNDLLVGTAKLAGVLLEREEERVVVGIGVNLAGAPPLTYRASTALAEHGPVPPLETFAATLADGFASLLSRWQGGDWSSLRAAWLARAHPAGTPLAVRDGSGRQLVGGFLGLAEDGAALLRLADGDTRVIHAGDVELVGERMVVGDAAGG